MALSSKRTRTRGRRVRASAEWQPLPAIVEPMAATTVDRLPVDVARWAFEYKWDGVRAIARWDGRNLNLYSRNLFNISTSYPELAPLGEALGTHEVMLDGEIIAADEQDRPSFARLQRRMHVRMPSERLVGEVPVYYVIFDLLHLDGRSMLRLPWRERRERLEELTLAGPSWRVSPAGMGEQGEVMLATARSSGLEGVMAKRVDSIYEAARRSANWLKIKVVQRQEFVVGGWAPQEGTTDVLGTLQVGYYDAQGQLMYAGSVGTGFDAATRGKLMQLLGRFETEKNPFGEKIPRKGVRFVVPAVVAEVEFRRWPAGGMIQQAAYKGLRRDKRAREVVKECPV